MDRLREEASAAQAAGGQEAVSPMAVSAGAEGLPELPQALNYAGGMWLSPESGQYTLSENPACASERVGRVAYSVAGDVDRAVRSAHRASPAWAGLAPSMRGELLRRAADAVEQDADGIARFMTREMGKTLSEARGEVLRGAAILRYYAAEGMRLGGTQLPAADGRTLLYTRRQPLGAAGLITPWNFPVAIPLWKLAPALVCGNTAVLKPDPNAGLTTGRMLAAVLSAGFPDGVINLVHGGREAGEALVRHPLVAAVSFTGSNAAGHSIAAVAAARGIKYQLELGGKNTVIVLPDADLEAAADAVISGAMRSAGQKCTATSKVIVLRESTERFTALLLERIGAIRLGNGLEPGVYCGPLATAAQQQKVLAHIRQGVAEGARLLCGGAAPLQEELANGYYVEPTLFDHVEPHMALAQQEIFGPVLAMMEASSFEEAMDWSNGTAYGLSAALWTSSLPKAMVFADRIQAGMVKVNGETAGVEYQAPFGGWKQSGSHSREQGQAALDFYTQWQTVALSL